MPPKDAPKEKKPKARDAHHASNSSLDTPLCSMEGVAITTQGPTSSNWLADLRCVMCLKLKGLAT